jgi:transcriptional regulator with XRE-family HTH domain
VSPNAGIRANKKTETLKAARQRLGLTQAQVAELLGTSQANVSAYEQSRLEPGALVASRIKALTKLEADSIYATYQASTLASAAAKVRTDLQRKRSEADMLRLVVQASDDFARLTTEPDRNFFLAEPSPTGSSRWDSLLAGLAVHLCRQADTKRTPIWVRSPARTLDSIWWFGRAEVVVDLRARVLQEAIPSMRARGVMLSREVLDSV